MSSEREGPAESVGLGGQEFWAGDQGDDGAEDTEDVAWKEFLTIESDDSYLMDGLQAAGGHDTIDQIPGYNGEEGILSHVTQSQRNTERSQLHKSDGFLATTKQCSHEEQIARTAEGWSQSRMKDNTMEVDKDGSEISEVVEKCSSSEACKEDMGLPKLKDFMHAKNGDTSTQVGGWENLCEENLLEEIASGKMSSHFLEEVDEMETTDDSEDESSVSSSDEEDEEQVEGRLSVENQLLKDEKKQHQKTIIDDSVGNMLSPYLHLVCEDDETDDEEEDHLEALAMASEEHNKDKNAKNARISKRTDGESSEEDALEVPRTKNEILVGPPVPKVEAVLEPHHKLESLGLITSVLDTMVIVEGHERHQALNEGSILWLLEQKSPLGFVDEIFGPVKKPFYSVRFNLPEDKPNEAKEGASVAYVPEFSIMVHGNPDLYKKGYDASGNNDEELSDNEWEFSDDEKEVEFKRMRSNAKKKDSAKEGDFASMRSQPDQKASNFVVSVKRQSEDHRRAFRSSPQSTIIRQTADARAMQQSTYSVEKEQSDFGKQIFTGSKAFESQCLEAPHGNDVSDLSHLSRHSPSHPNNRPYNNGWQSFSQPPSHLAGKITRGSVTNNAAHPIRPSQCALSQFTGQRLPETHSGLVKLNARNYQHPQPSPSTGSTLETRNHAISYQRPQHRPDFARIQGSTMNAKQSISAFGVDDVQTGCDQFLVSRVPPNQRYLPAKNYMEVLRPPLQGHPAETTKPQGRVTNEFVRPPQSGLQINTLDGQHASQYQQAVTSMATLGVHANAQNNQPALQYALNMVRTPPRALLPLQPQPQLFHVPHFPARPENVHGQIPTTNPGAIDQSVSAFGVEGMQSVRDQSSVYRVPPNQRYLPADNHIAILRPPLHPSETTQGRIMNDCVRPPQFGLSPNMFGGQHPFQHHQAMTSMATLGDHANAYNNQPALQSASNMVHTPIARPPSAPLLPQPQPFYVPGFLGRRENVHGQIPMANPEAIDNGFDESTAHINQQAAQQQLNGVAIYHQETLPGRSSQWPPGQVMRFMHPGLSQPTFQGLHTIGIPVPSNAINMDDPSHVLLYQGTTSQLNHAGVVPHSNQFGTQVQGGPFLVHQAPQ
ncbi:hypothetical protein O6H91_11G109800 [Diphasiastrum complanatum]|nr:hypothetical protein O6H91_11G109800 [Diphasiastrum complanatum]KAJ7539812.1 hypothetical protein O6H91_11G109800 [Diphasiastrum complanatum]